MAGTNQQIGQNSQTDQSKQEIVKIFEDADRVYAAVMSQLDIAEEDEVYYELVQSMLERQTKDHMIFSIWNNLTDGQSKHLKDYLNQTSVIMPWMSTDDILIEFAMMYPTLMDQIYESLTGFFKGFIAKFNEFGRA